MRRYLAPAALFVTVLLSLPGTVLATYFGTTNLVPPPDGVYLTPPQVHATYNGPGLVIVLQDIQHHGFGGITRVDDGSGGTLEHFNSVVDGNVSINGSPFQPISLSGPVSVDLHNYHPGDLGTFNTEMLQLDLTGGGAMIRESPTLSSLGQTTITDIGGGQFRIDSFFDVFTELSLDGGQTFIPSTSSTHVDLARVPEPPTLVPLALAFASLAGHAWRRRGK